MIADRLKRAEIRKDIFVAVITSGSMKQKENWEETAKEASDWVFEEPEMNLGLMEETTTSADSTTAVMVPSKKTRRRRKKN